MNNSDIVKRGIVGAMILAIFVLAFLILKPIIVSIIFGLLFAYIFSPVYKKLHKKTKKKNLSAFLIILALILIVAVPIFYLVPKLVNQTFETYVAFQNLNIDDVLGKIIKTGLTDSVTENFKDIINNFFTGVIGQLTNLLVNLPSMMLQFAVFLFTFFFVIRDSESLRDYISTLSPFSRNVEKKLMNEFRDTTNAIVLGQVLVGIIQGIALGAGLFILKVPNALILTFIASILCMIPFAGAWIVWAPVSGYLVATGKIFPAIFLALYGLLFVSTIDNFLRPYILSKRSSLPMAISIIGTIGGLYMFGFAGILLGPLILAYVLIIIEFYQKGKLNELFHSGK